MALIRIAPGELAAVVTTLEMRERPCLGPIPDAPLTLARLHAPSVDRYQTLFRRVGAPWLWYSRLAMTGERLTAIIHHPAIEIHAAVDQAGDDIGMLELDFREAGACELSYFGLVPALAGRGLGRWLMAEALARAWRPDITRVWLHTCTLDHPSALGFYRAQGFAAIGRTIETFRDPRLSGLLPREAAPQIALLG